MSTVSTCSRTFPPGRASSGKRAIGTDKRFLTGAPTSIAIGSSTHFPHAAAAAQAAPHCSSCRLDEGTGDDFTAADVEVEDFARDADALAERLAHRRQRLRERHVAALP